MAGVYEPDENLYRVLHTVTFGLVNQFYTYGLVFYRGGVK